MREFRLGDELELCVKSKDAFLGFVGVLWHRKNSAGQLGGPLFPMSCTEMPSHEYIYIYIYIYRTEQSLMLSFAVDIIAYTAGGKGQS